MSKSWALLLVCGIFAAGWAQYTPLALRTVNVMNKTWTFIKSGRCGCDGHRHRRPDGLVKHQSAAFVRHSLLARDQRTAARRRLVSEAYHRSTSRSSTRKSGFSSSSRPRFRSPMSMSMERSWACIKAAIPVFRSISPSMLRPETTWSRCTLTRGGAIPLLRSAASIFLSAGFTGTSTCDTPTRCM